METRFIFVGAVDEEVVFYTRVRVNTTESHRRDWSPHRGRSRTETPPSRDSQKMLRVNGQTVVRRV